MCSVFLTKPNRRKVAQSYVFFHWVIQINHSVNIRSFEQFRLDEGIHGDKRDKNVAAAMLY